MEPDRTRARELAAEYLAKGEPAGWFEQLYQEAEAGKSTIPWADLTPNPNLLSFWFRSPMPTEGKTALTVGCGLGDDAEQLAAWGFQTTAFDISETAIAACRKRFPSSLVHYAPADLLALPSDWKQSFDFVLESYTVQALPPFLRHDAIQAVTSAVRQGGHLLLIAQGREEGESAGPPWPLTPSDLDRFGQTGLRELSREDYFDKEEPPVRRFRALYQRL